MPQIKRNFYEAAGNIFTNTGLVIASHEGPLKIKAVFALSAAMSVYLAARNKPANGIAQPLLANAVGAASSAMSTNVAEVRMANTLWTMGYLSLDSLLKHGGVAQAVQKAKARLWGALQQNIEP